MKARALDTSKDYAVLCHKMSLSSTQRALRKTPGSDAEKMRLYLHEGQVDPNALRTGMTRLQILANPPV